MIERWTISKLDFLIMWGIPSLVITVPISVAAWFLNTLTGGAIQQIITTIAVIVVTVVATVRAVWLLFWCDVE